MINMDQLDRKILWQLDRDGRQSYAQLSRTLRQSRERIDYRINRLVDRGIIEGFSATINPQRLGYGIYKTYLRLENNRPQVEALIKHLRKHERLAWCAICDGSWDLAFCLYAKSAKEFHDLHVNILSQFNPVVLNFVTYSLINVVMFSRSYFWKGTKEMCLLGGDQERYPIDELDVHLLRLLQRDARMSVAELAERLDLTQATAQSRIVRLENAQVITGYRVNTNLAKLGLMFVKTMFFLRNYELSLRKEFREFCDAHPNITCYTEQIGDCNLEIELHVPNLDVYSAILDEIRGRYAKLIRNFYTMMLRETDYHWVPRAAHIENLGTPTPPLMAM